MMQDLAARALRNILLFDISNIRHLNPQLDSEVYGLFVEQLIVQLTSIDIMGEKVLEMLESLNAEGQKLRVNKGVFLISTKHCGQEQQKGKKVSDFL